MDKIETKIIGAFLLVGGSLGAYRSLVALSQNVDFFKLILLLIMAGIMVFTVFSGYQILKKEIKGLENGRAIMAIQFIQFAIAGFGLSFYTGGYFGIHYLEYDIGFSFKVDSAFIINFFDDTSYFFIRINLLAIFIFIYLTRLLKTLNKEAEDH